MTNSAYFVTGTDTGVGKTIFATYLAKCGQAHYWKPVQCGHPTDKSLVGELIGSQYTFPETYSFKAPLSPHQAAQEEETHIDLAHITLPKKSPLVVEGAGGVWVPLTWQKNMMDLMVQLKIPVILVARSTLGTLNHSLLSIEALRRRRIQLHSLVMVGRNNEGNRRSLERLGDIPVFVFPHFSPLEEFHQFDLEEGRDFFWGNHG